MRVLVTNDDGFDAPGLAPLARMVRQAGHDTVVVAPLSDMSGSGASLGDLAGLTRITPLHKDLDGLPSGSVYALDGPPARCVVAAHLGVVGEPPDLVVSGVNPGANTGRAVLHSGTVGAALTAANFGYSGLAVSLGWSDTDDYRWDTAVAYAERCLPWLTGAPARTALNLNVPNLAAEQVLGVREAELATVGAATSVVHEVEPGVFEYNIEPTDMELPDDSDTALVRAGYVSVTSLQPVSALDLDPVLLKNLG